MREFFRCVASSITQRGVAGLSVDPVPGGRYLSDLADDVCKGWLQGRDRQRVRSDIEEMAQASFEQIRDAAKEVASVAADADLRSSLELYLTQVPAAVRQSLKRPDDLDGKTVPIDFDIQDEDDVAKLLPARMPRYRPGDAPGFLKGWILEEQLGNGGFGEVWKGRNRRAQSLTAAFKFGHALNARDFALLHEGDVINRVMEQGEHPGIVALRDAWADGDDVPWLRYDYVPGGDLTSLFHAWQKLPPEQRVGHVVTALMDLAETVGYFHRLDPAIVHRDLKPSNILVGAGGKLKITDFGIGAVSARRLLAGDTLGSISQGGRVQTIVRGSYTPIYAPPEQRDLKHKAHPRDDVHALGVIAFQMITGHLNRGVGSDFEEELTDCGASPELARLLARCVATRPERRPKDALELRDMLAAGGVAKAGQKQTVTTLPAMIVAQDGTGQFKQLQEAITAAKPGAKIVVKPGIYGPITIDKPLDLEGDGPISQILVEASGGSACLVCSASRASIKGMKFAMLANGCGVIVERGDVTLSDCDISAGNTCVHAKTAAQVNLSGCRILGSRGGDGCEISNGVQLTVEDCTISGHAGCGVVLQPGAEAIITSSSINRNATYGLVVGARAAATVTKSDLTQNGHGWCSNAGTLTQTGNKV